MKRYTTFTITAALLAAIFAAGCGTSSSNPACSDSVEATAPSVCSTDAINTCATVGTSAVTHQDNNTATDIDGSTAPITVDTTKLKGATTQKVIVSTTTTVPTTPTTSPTSNEGTPTIIMPNAQQLAYISDKVVELVNAERKRLGIAPLGVPDKLTEAANIRAEECIQGANGSTNGHNRPNGDIFSTVFADVKYGEPQEYEKKDQNGNWITIIGYYPGQSSENLANITSWNDREQLRYGFTCTPAELNRMAQDLFESWKGSTPHYKAMTNLVFTKSGVGVVAQPNESSGYANLAFTGIQLFTEK